MDYLFEARMLAGLVEYIDLHNRDGFDSLNLFNEMAILQPGLLNKLQMGLQWIKNNNIHAVIIGGTSVVHYVTAARSLTPDIDFLTADMAIVADKANKDGLSVKPINMTSHRGLTIDEFDADFVDANHGGLAAIHRYILDHPQMAQIGGSSFPVIAPEVLCVMKFAIGRDKDDADAFLLLQSGTFTKEQYLKVVSDLRKSLKDVSTLKMYAQMIK